MPSGEGGGEVFTTLFRRESGEGEEKRKDKLSDAVETIQLVSPAKVKKRDSRFLSQSKLTIEIDKLDMSRAGDLEITTGNPPPREVDPIP